MNIIYHHRTRGVGVEGVHIREVINAFREKEHIVEIACYPGTDTTDKVINYGNYNNNIISTIWSTICNYTPQFIFEVLEIFSNLLSFRFLKSKFNKDFSTDFIYERYSVFCFAGVLFSRIYKIPIIIEVNDATFIERNRHAKLKKLARKIECMIFRKADLIITISHYFKDLLAQNGVDLNKIIVIQNATDTRKFIHTVNIHNVKKKYYLYNELIVGYAGSMAYYQGMDILFESIEKIIYKYNNVKFLIIGDYDKLNQEYKDFANQYKDKIILTGLKNHAEMPQFINTMDITVLPNSNIHGSPMKIFEYMATKKAVLAPKLPPILEVIIDNYNGLLFEPNNKDEFFLKLDQLIIDDKLRKKLGHNARETIKRNFTWDIYVDKVINKYNEIKLLLN